ncbi:uncharacterized protein LOC127835348 isoform X2 [Dreissena polymorpha]|uniref:uncharacterized protein LOC127835348 isoform X2 n=1 Tax=Dreissena polymorpha TaxID=45954 RepID=UPI002264BE33|nr:uncharacterized protein LOC127835348 isoform X2 [Dreissena polymorpha]
MNDQSSLIQEYFYRERSYSDSGKENFRKQHDDIGPRNIDVVSSNDTHTNKSSSRSFDLGLLRDFTGSYVYSYHLLGTMSLLGGVIMYCLQFIGENQGAMDTETVAKKPS